MADNIIVGSKLELRPGFESFYAKEVVAGARGLAERTRIDGDDYELVHIKWDREHWRYNGQQDGWTYASHFKVLEEPPSVTDQFIAQARARSEQEGWCEHCQRVHSPEEDRADLFFHTLQEAFDIATDSEGFLMLAITSEPDPLNPERMLTIPVLIGRSLSEEATVLLETQLIQLAALAYQDFVQDSMEALREEKDEPGRSKPEDQDEDRQ